MLPPPRPWWKLWGKEEREPELPAIVADLRNAAWPSGYGRPLLTLSCAVAVRPSLGTLGQVFPSFPSGSSILQME